MKPQRGFSLLELLIVIGLMSTAALLALSAVDQGDNQRRFDETRAKLRHIQHAILGEGHNINGVYSQSGFVADMGRLPYSIEELLVQPTDCDQETKDDQHCDWQYDADSETWGGWRGPYLSGVLSGDEHTAEYDGWGNKWRLLDEYDGSEWHMLTIQSNGLTHSPSDSSESLDANYRDVSLQSFTLKPHHYLRELPHNPLYLHVVYPPEVGHCIDTDNDANEQQCQKPGNRNRWESAYEQCVDERYKTAQKCDEANSSDTASPRYVWAAIYGRCNLTNKYADAVTCEAAGHKWDKTEKACWLIDVSSEAECENVVSDDCSETPDNGKCIAEWQPEPSNKNNLSFLADDKPFCVRPMHYRHGRFNANSHRSQKGVMKKAQQNPNPDGPTGNRDDVFAYSPSMETDSDKPVQQMRLPLGPLRFGLYYYYENNEECSLEPFPSKTAQGRSQVYRLGHDFPPNIGTKQHPILIDWRSR